MTSITYIQIILLLSSCSPPQQNTASNEPEQDTDTAQEQIGEAGWSVLKKEKGDQQGNSPTDTLCSLGILTHTYENLDSLDLQRVATFLATFNDSCSINVEYSERSNELLFEMINRRADLFLEVMKMDASLSRESIIEELANPIHDGIDLEATIESVENVDVPDAENWKARIINSLEVAREKL